MPSSQMTKVKSYDTVVRFPVEPDYDYVELQQKLNEALDELRIIRAKLARDLQTNGVSYDQDGNLTLTDESGSITIGDIIKWVDRFWEYKDAYGPKAQNLAGEETWIGTMEDIDGVTNFNSTDEVE